MTKAAKESDKERKAAALRANLRRRKAAKTADQSEPNKPPEDSRDD